MTNWAWLPSPTDYRQLVFAAGPLLLAAASLLAWLYLALLHGRFWHSGPELPAPSEPAPCRVACVVPARDEAEHIAVTVRSLLAQDLPGCTLHVVVVDDNSTDGTGAILAQLATEDSRLLAIPGSPLPAGWTGKMWAVQQGLDAADGLRADFVLLTDADIRHAPPHLAHLVGYAQRSGSDLVSEMVRLRCETLAERATIPAFVFFFAMLYPFRQVADPGSRTAAAAGGTMLLSAAALKRIGGVSRIRAALIDDCALAREVKRGTPGEPAPRLWLGHATAADSDRRYPGFGDVWHMIARTAYVQLRHSPVLLAGTCLAMLLLYVAPVALAILASGWARAFGASAWLLMALLFQPTLRRYRQSPLWGVALPAIGVFYMLATVGSAVRHARGRGGQWKNRVYPA